MAKSVKKEPKSDIAEWNRVFDRMANDREKSQKQLTKRLGKPDLFVPADESGLEGVGYWRVPGGIISFRRFRNCTYDPFSRGEYEESFVKSLFAVLEKPEREI